MSLFIKPILLAVVGLIALIPFMTESERFMNEVSVNRELVKQVETDSIRYDLWLLKAENERPVQYMAEIFTPVCYSDKCYPVFIDFYWDLLGNFQHYEMPPGKTLTKLDHILFEPEDYQKMQRILANTSSLLKDFKAEDLVVSTESDLPYGVDAVTGATSKTIQNEVISGAVYSCYTLWHLANGEISAQIKAYTEKNYDDSLIISFLQSSNYHYQYWAIENVLTSGRWDEENFKTPLLNILRGNNVFVAEHVLEIVPKSVWEETKQQEWLWETYLMSSYRLQLKILEKFRQLKLVTSLHHSVITQLEKSNQEQKKRIFLVLSNHSNLTKESQQALIPYLDDNRWGQEARAVLSFQKKLDKTVKKEIDQSRTTPNRKN
ncbi:hypothetical protein [Lunatibacter salilacus]|uniref:hypothetical protein n=1 Tax=Lunatibacter salilacus TaxID=2483804 RepID=UPI00131E733B|nr:hypothetical protein [Lunatibacter salilacus]